VGLGFRRGLFLRRRLGFDHLRLRLRDVGLLGDRRELGQDHRRLGVLRHVEQVREPVDAERENAGMQASREYVRRPMHRTTNPNSDRLPYLPDGGLPTSATLVKPPVLIMPITSRTLP